MASQFEAELSAWQKHIKPKIPGLMVGKFKDVLEVVNNGNIKPNVSRIQNRRKKAANI